MYIHHSIVLIIVCVRAVVTYDECVIAMRHTFIYCIKTYLKVLVLVIYQCGDIDNYVLV